MIYQHIAIQTSDQIVVLCSSTLHLVAALDTTLLESLLNTQEYSHFSILPKLSDDTYRLMCNFPHLMSNHAHI
jgi:hypothetical protein